MALDFFDFGDPLIFVTVHSFESGDTEKYKNMHDSKTSACANYIDMNVAQNKHVFEIFKKFLNKRSRISKKSWKKSCGSNLLKIVTS